MVSLSHVGELTFSYLFIATSVLLRIVICFKKCKQKLFNEKFIQTDCSIDILKNKLKSSKFDPAESLPPFGMNLQIKKKE